MISIGMENTSIGAYFEPFIAEEARLYWGFF
jgi:hypothetical protein